jgi:hypothetical protein
MVTAARFGQPREFLTSAWPGISHPGSERKDAEMNRIGSSWRVLRVLRSLPLTAALTGMGLAGIAATVAGCGGGSSPAVNAPPASAHTAAEQAAVMNWLANTNQMWTSNDFAGLEQVTTG